MMNVKKQIWKHLILTLMVGCSIGCSSNRDNTAKIKEEIGNKTLNQEAREKDFTPNKKVIETWKIDTAAWKSLPHKWVGLERSNTGYVVYEPCDGVTPTFDLDSLKLKIAGQWQDGVIAFSIRDFQKIGKHEYRIISEEEGWARLELNLKRVKPSLNLWLLNGFIKERQRDMQQALTWVVTTKMNAEKFPVIKNPCPTQKVPEKTFLPIEFEH